MKTCSQCKTEKPLDAFYLLKSGKADGRCKDCRKANARADHWARRDQHLARMKERHQANRDAEIAAMRDRNPTYYLAHREKLLAKHHENRDQALTRMKTARVEMTDYYLRWLICQGSQLKPEDIPAELVAAKREQLTMRRMARQLKGATNESRENSH